MKLKTRLPLVALIGLVWAVILAVDYVLFPTMIRNSFSYYDLMYKVIAFTVGMIIIDLGVRRYLSLFSPMTRRDRINRLLGDLDEQDRVILREQLDDEQPETSLEGLLQQKRKNLS